MLIISGLGNRNKGMKIKILSLIILFFSIGKIAAQTSGSNDWVWQYPKPQGNNLRDIYVFNDDTAIAVGDLSTIIKTTDGGNTWAVQSNVSPSQILYSVQFIDANNGWAAGGNYLLKTIDGGISWSQVNRDTAYAIFAVYFVDSDTGFVFGANGYLSRTTDGGTTWKTQIMDNYIGAYLDIFNFTAVTFTDKNTGWLVGTGYDGNEIYKTTDCGRTWVWNEQIITPIDFSSLNDIYFIDKNHGFIVGSEGAFIKTTNGGTTWQYKNLCEQNPNNVELQSFSSVYFADTVNGFIVGGEDYKLILKTTDGGESWAEIDSNNSTDHPYKIRFADNNKGWIVGQFGMIYRTTDAGNDWTSQREDKHIFNSIYFIDENTGWAVGDSGTIINTTDGGDNWEKQITSNNLVLNSVYAFDNQNVIAVGEATNLIYSIILQTINGGQTWQTHIDTLGALNAISFPSRNTGYAVGKNILKTTDGGLTWHVQSNLTNFEHVQFIDENTGWISAYGDTALLKTTNGGNTWKSQLIDPNFNAYSFNFINAEMGWAAGVGYNPITYYWDRYIFKTTNGGDSWIQCSNTPRSIYHAVQFIDESTGWAMGDVDDNGGFGVIIKTTDGGNTWRSQECPSPSMLSNLFILNANTGWAAGTGIFKTTDGGGIASVKGGNNNGNLPKQITLYQNYPNPFNPSTIISWKLNLNSHVILKVYDILGREISTLVNKNMDAGSYNISWNASKMASGVYFYRLWVNSINNNQAGNFIETKKMMLIR
jgi:photosystem II stability/assembly factor-like uncharacterized protein